MKRKIICALLILVIILGGFVVIVQSGYIVLPGTLTVEEPIGNSEEIDEAKEKQNCEYQSVKSFIEEAPGIENIEYGLFRTDSNKKSVYSDYKQRLQKQGYKEELKYSGKIKYKGLNIQYHTFIKGLTGVVIGIFKDKNENVNVLYTTGSVLQYQEIMKWIKSN